ncbi:MAG: NADH-quinone oxidoreductase subunit N [Chloroflexi bacterium RBG_13_48_17]|nr:MAG: NADH-quinone oxidoreductase subunit N [Chloroflexi bacterium RBG_13_48_17]
MPFNELRFLTPELGLLGFAVMVILLDLFIKQKRVLAGISVAGVIVSAGFTVAMWGQTDVTIFGRMLAIDNFALFFKLLMLLATGLIILASQDYVRKFQRFQGEYYALLLLSAVGMMLLVAASDLISIYIALELTGISLYVLASFLKDRKSSEAGLKYLLLGAVASAVLLYGMALVFGFTGMTCLMCIAEYVQGMHVTGLVSNPALLLAMVLLAAGFGFKIACFPFQMWVPDVYEGAPTPITAYLSVASKAAGFAVILRVFFVALGSPEWLSLNWGMMFAVLSAITMTVGNVTAILQTNIKRMLGYSSIAQAGYIMVGLATVGMAVGHEALGQSGLIFFLVSYAVTNLGAFIAVIAISNKIDSDEINKYTGMGKRAPLLAAALTLCLISLIGLPPTAGLIAKIYIFSGAVQNGLLWLVIVAVINSAISAFYYLRVVKVMWAGAPASEEKVPSSWALRTALGFCCFFVVLLGVIPGAFVGIAEAAARILVGL